MEADSGTRRIVKGTGELQTIENQVTSLRWDDIVFHLAWIGALASIAAMIITCFVAYSVRKIRQSFFHRVRLGHIVEALNKAATRAQRAAKRDKNLQQAGGELSKCRVHLDHAAKVLPKQDTKDSIQTARDYLAQADLSSPTTSVIDKAITLVEAAATQLDHVQTDKEWK